MPVHTRLQSQLRRLQVQDSEPFHGLGKVRAPYGFRASCDPPPTLMQTCTNMAICFSRDQTSWILRPARLRTQGEAAAAPPQPVPAKLTGGALQVGLAPLRNRRRAFTNNQNPISVVRQTMVCIAPLAVLWRHAVHFCCLHHPTTVIWRTAACGALACASCTASLLSISVCILKFPHLKVQQQGRIPELLMPSTSKASSPLHAGWFQAGSRNAQVLLCCSNMLVCLFPKSLAIWAGSGQ